MRADDPPAFGKTHPALRLPSRCRCPNPLEFGVGGCEIRPETGDDRFLQAARRRSADPRRPERLDRRDTVAIMAGADPQGDQAGRATAREIGMKYRSIQMATDLLKQNNTVLYKTS